MASEQVKYRVCDKCPKETVATETHKLNLNGYRYDIDLCVSHAAALYVSVMNWADLGTLVGEPTVFDKPRSLTAPESLPNLPPKVSARAVATRPAERHTGVVVADFADRWAVTTHAKERMAERGINLADALWAAEYPDVKLPSAKRLDGYMDHYRGDIMVVVADRTIITVAQRAAVSLGRQAANGT